MESWLPLKTINRLVQPGRTSSMDGLTFRRASYVLLWIAAVGLPGIGVPEVAAEEAVDYLLFDESCAQDLSCGDDLIGCHHGSCQSLCCRQQLTGDWFGRRSSLAQHGITLDADVTQFYFGVASGGLNQRFDYGGHGDYVVDIDMGKLANREGLFVKLRAEHRFGETIANDTGAFFPPTVAANLPVSGSNDLYLTNVLFTQALSESFALFAGKLDTFDGDQNAFAHGRGKTQFSNLGFVVNPALVRTVPYSTLGAGFVLMDEGLPYFTFTAMNATDTANSAGFNQLFEEGVALIAELRLPTEFYGLPGHQTFGGTWNSREYTTLGQDPRIILPDVPINQQSGSWALYYNFDQYLSVDACDPTKGWGIFGRAAITDDRTNPVAWFLSTGLGGNSWLYGREADTFGIGWYYSSTSDEIGPLLQAVTGPLGAGNTTELFYNIEVTPWFRLTPDVQIIDSARERVDTAIVVGLRGQVIF